MYINSSKPPYCICNFMSGFLISVNMYKAFYGVKSMFK